ncbi:MAG: hypothetical protein QOD75_763 [Blastocatellia bacterium]|jgi:hypothetical protein|nr:hypothetical protein [Blastocatellia bacterium]
MIVNEAGFPSCFHPFANPFRLTPVLKIAAVVLLLLLAVGVIVAQENPVQPHDDPAALVIAGNNDGTVFGMGRSLKITGNVQGAIAFGGDVFVEGTVAGDVAAVGGSIIQREGSRIGGDVIVIGGSYHHGKAAPGRDPQKATIMYAGYEDQLRKMMREPATLLSPRLSASFLGWRLLVILFWFVVSLAITAAMPSTVSRAMARLQLTSLRVALIGLLGAVVIVPGCLLCLWLLPTPVGVLVGILALLLLIVATLFGRVVVFAATGRWLQRRFLSRQAQSESIALLLGVSFWIVLSSLPYVWPIVFGSLLIISLGLALTARYRVAWQRQDSSDPFSSAKTL